jgi:hypothetical protein
VNNERAAKKPNAGEQSPNNTDTYARFHELSERTVEKCRRDARGKSETRKWRIVITGPVRLDGRAEGVVERAPDARTTRQQLAGQELALV